MKRHNLTISALCRGRTPRIWKEKGKKGRLLRILVDEESSKAPAYCLVLLFLSVRLCTAMSVSALMMGHIWEVMMKVDMAITVITQMTGVVMAFRTSGTLE